MKNLSRILRYLRDHRLSILWYCVSSMLAAFFGVVSIGMLAPVLNVLFAGGSLQMIGNNAGLWERAIYTFRTTLLAGGDKLHALTLICVTVVAFVLLKNIFLYTAVNILLPVRHALVRRLRNDMFEKMLSLPIGYFTEERKGDLMSRMTNDVNEIQTSVMSVMEVVVREPINIAILLLAMIAISPGLSVFLLVFLPISGLVIGKIGSSLRRAARKMAEQMGDITSVLDETLSGMRVVKAFNAERTQYLRFLKLNNENFRLRNRSARRQELASPLSETMGVTVVAVILWYGGRLVLRQESDLSPELFITYIALFTQIINPVKNLSSAINQVQKGSAALERIEAILQTENTIHEHPNALPVLDFNQQIALRNVQFAYGTRAILMDISLNIPKGKTIALVGSSGAGKSTLADLIPRFHDVTGGELLIDGINIKEYKLDQLRRLIGIVNQEPILFNDTIANNISLGVGGATRAQIEEAARVAYAHDFILQKPDGYDTIVGDRGSKLSGGERQRITIARAVLKNPPILILDEATSSLDTESERAVQHAINNLMKHRTCIVIAHRLSTIRHADEIVVLQNGRIVEQGQHESLLAASGIYRRLVELQEVR